MKCDYDLVVASRRSVAKAWLPLLRAVCPEAPVVFDTVDSALFAGDPGGAVAKGYEYDATLSASENARHLITKYPNLQNTKTWRSYEEGYTTELRVMNASDATIVVSGVERRELEALKRQGALRSTLPSSCCVEHPRYCAKTHGALHVQPATRRVICGQLAAPAERRRREIFTGRSTNTGNIATGRLRRAHRRGGHAAGLAAIDHEGGPV